MTGAASGLGLAMAEAMAEGGAQVTLADLDADGLGAGRRSARRRRAHGHVDVSDAAAVDRLFDEVAEEQGGVDVAFANAGYLARGRRDRPAGGLEASTARSGTPCSA